MGLALRVREKLPEILIEACSVALAVLLALWANEWSDERKLRQQSAALEAAVDAELRSNLADLEGSRSQLRAALGEARRYLDPAGAGMRSLRFDVGLSLLSEAAFRTAQSSDAVQRLDTGWRIEAARTYELQALYERQQEALLDTLNAIVSDTGALPASARVRTAELRLRTMLELNQQLAGQYRALLARSPR